MSSAYEDRMGERCQVHREYENSGHSFGSIVHIGFQASKEGSGTKSKRHTCFRIRTSRLSRYRENQNVDMHYNNSPRI